ncbi:MAG: hypothetical protein IKW74_03810 [Thermoguttaceae bacterium]|nr:hypothetical protein [Thermoguttaceae bacterium]
MTAKSWDEIRARWNSSWGALEVWNEPDISFGGNLPADQYVPLLKTLSWQFAVSKEKTPLIGGVIALYQDPWMKTAAKSGILDYCDIFSYHTYCRAPEFAACTKKYIQWLADNNQAGKPLWLTECGRPWKKGTDRPDREADKISAIDIVMKGVEAKACGVDRYFPFVYPYYEERDSNFGMCDKNNTPLHALAAYAQMIRVLSNQKYIGDYAAKPEGVDVARVFQGEDKKWIVFYTASPGKDCFISLPFTPVNVERITGEQIACEQGKSIDFSEGFLYVEVPADQPVELQQDSEIAKMHYLREKTRNTETVPLRKVSPLVLRYDRDQASTSFNSSGYQITRLSGNEFSVKLTLFNLSDEKKTVPVTYQVNHEKIILKDPQSVTVPPQDKISFPMTLDISSVSEITPLELTITAEDTIHLLFTRETQFEQLPDIVSETTQIDLSPEDRWVKNKPGYCNADFLAPSERDSDSQWGMKFTFSGNGDRWAYPIYTVPRDFTSEYLTRSVYKGDAQNPSSEFSPAHYDGFALRVKATANDPEKTTIRLFTYDEERKSYYYTPGGITKADGNWLFIIVPFDRLSPFTNTPAAFDPDKIHYISVGGNTGEISFTVEVSHFYLYKK